MTFQRDSNLVFRHTFFDDNLLMSLLMDYLAFSNHKYLSLRHVRWRLNSYDLESAGQDLLQNLNVMPTRLFAYLILQLLRNI